MTAQSANAEGLRKAARRVFWEASQIEKAEKRARLAAFNEILEIVAEIREGAVYVDATMFEHNRTLGDMYFGVTALDEVSAAIKHAMNGGAPDNRPLTPLEAQASDSHLPSDWYIREVFKIEPPSAARRYAAFDLMHSARQAAFALLGGAVETPRERRERFDALRPPEPTNLKENINRSLIKDEVSEFVRVRTSNEQKQNEQ